MKVRTGGALMRAGAGAALAAVLAVLTAGVVAAGPQRSSAAPAAPPPRAQVRLPIPEVVPTTVRPAPSRPTAPAPAGVRRRAVAGQQGQAGRRAVSPAAGPRLTKAVSPPPHAVRAPRRSAP